MQNCTISNALRSDTLCRAPITKMNLWVRGKSTVMLVLSGGHGSTAQLGTDAGHACTLLTDNCNDDKQHSRDASKYGEM